MHACMVALIMHSLVIHCTVHITHACNTHACAYKNGSKLVHSYKLDSKLVIAITYSNEMKNLLIVAVCLLVTTVYANYEESILTAMLREKNNENENAMQQVYN